MVTGRTFAYKNRRFHEDKHLSSRFALCISDSDQSPDYGRTKFEVRGKKTEQYMLTVIPSLAWRVGAGRQRRGARGGSGCWRWRPWPWARRRRWRRWWRSRRRRGWWPSWSPSEAPRTARRTAAPPPAAAPVGLRWPPPPPPSIERNPGYFSLNLLARSFARFRALVWSLVGLCLPCVCSAFACCLGWDREEETGDGGAFCCSVSRAGGGEYGQIRWQKKVEQTMLLDGHGRFQETGGYRSDFKFEKFMYRPGNWNRFNESTEA